MPPLRIYLLGQIRAENANGTPVSGQLWRRTKVRALLAFMLIHHGRPLHRELLLETLWPHLDHDAASRNLDTTVYDLRKSLEPNLARGAESAYVQRLESSYFLVDASRHWVDAWAFQTAIERARREDEAERAIAFYHDALALYCDHFLAELGSDAPWCRSERRRLGELALCAQEELALYYERRGEQRAAAEIYESILVTDPCRESACRRLMQLHLRRGERIKAVLTYRNLTQALKQEVGVEPSQELRRLYEQAART